jgi:hypothetical protein
MPAGADAPEDKLGGLASQVPFFRTNVVGTGKDNRNWEISVADPDPVVRATDPDPSIIKQNSKKNLDSYRAVL